MSRISPVSNNNAVETAKVVTKAPTMVTVKPCVDQSPGTLSTLRTAQARRPNETLAIPARKPDEMKITSSDLGTSLKLLNAPLLKARCVPNSAIAA